ncbi:MAG: alpha/beta fold hydrolase [Gammaproteobacteria bacterium]
MGTPRRGYLEGPAGQVHYRRAGEGGEPLLLLHQSPLSSPQFDAVLPRLAAQGFDALALDLPGYGMSDEPAAGATLEDYAGIIPAAMGAMGWSRAHLLGHHSGAVLAAVYAASRPPGLDRLVLNGFPLLGEAERKHFATFHFGPKEPKPDGSHLLVAWQNRLRATPGWADLALMHRYTVEGLHRGGSNWRMFPLVIAADMEPVLRRIAAPTLLFTNTGEDLCASTRRAHALRPDDFAYAELEGGTHDIIDEQPEAWTRVVAGFLRGAVKAP